MPLKLSTIAESAAGLDDETARALHALKLKRLGVRRGVSAELDYESFSQDCRQGDQEPA